MNLLKSLAGKYYNNLRGWSTNRKILVFESDDWGSIRMPSKAVFDECVNNGYPVNQRPFEMYDHLEAFEDLDSLCRVLRSFSDYKGRHPVFTANIIMTNPDFEKIREFNFTTYYSEHFSDSYIKYYGDNQIFKFWQNAITDGTLYPQYHGSEHFNISKWLTKLQNGDRDMHFAFDRKMVGIPLPQNPELGNELLIALASDSEDDLKLKIERFLAGYDLFEKTFGFSSASFIAPVYTWNNIVIERMAVKGLKYIQGGRFQKMPDYNTGRMLSVKHFLGEKNHHGQIYLVRNVFFEPSVSGSKTIIEKSIEYINAAFRMRKPAIVSTHRLNYMGGLDDKNREQNLNLLADLIQRVLKEHPQVEFMNSVQLGDLIRANN